MILGQLMMGARQTKNAPLANAMFLFAENVMGFVRDEQLNMLFEDTPLAILFLCKANKRNTATLTISSEARGLTSP